MGLTRTCTVDVDEFTSYVSDAFDYTFDGVSTFDLPKFEKPSGDFSIGLIIGSSGSGKTSLLREHYGYSDVKLDWNPHKSVLSHFSSPKCAVDRCFAAGLGSVPTLCKPFHVLSNGEQYRAIVARLIGDGAIIDEFTSVVNRETAKSLSVSIRKYIMRSGLKGVVFSSCHTDIINFLCPDWIFDCNSGLFSREIKPHDDMQKVAEVKWYV